MHIQAQDESRPSHRPPWMMTSSLQYGDLPVMLEELKYKSADSTAHTVVSGIRRRAHSTSSIMGILLHDKSMAGSSPGRSLQQGQTDLVAGL